MAIENPVVWFEMYVDDMDRAKKFYETVLDIELSALPTPVDELSMVAFPMNMESANRASGALVKMEGMNPGGNSTLVYFFSEDCSVEENRVNDAGGKVFRPKMSIGDYGFITLATDTEGNMIGIHSMH